MANRPIWKAAAHAAKNIQPAPPEVVELLSHRSKQENPFVESLRSLDLHTDYGIAAENDDGTPMDEKEVKRTENQIRAAARALGGSALVRYNQEHRWIGFRLREKQKRAKK